MLFNFLLMLSTIALVSLNPIHASTTHLGNMDNLEQSEAVIAMMEGWSDFFRNMTVYSPSSSAVFQKEPNRAIYFSDADYPLYNGILEDDLNTPIKDQEIEDVLKFFKNRKCSFCWWTASTSLEAKGFKLGGVMRGVALDLTQQVSSFSSPPGLQIRIVHNEEELREFCQISGSEMSSQMIDLYQEVFRSTAKYNEQLHFLGYLNGKPVAVLTLTFSKKSAGIWNAATLPEYRKRGIFTALMDAALAEAKKRGYSCATGLLMPKGMAWGTFQRFGFREVCNFPFYLYGFDPNSLETKAD